MRRLSFLQVELSDLQEYNGLTYEEYQTDRRVRREVERLVENLANACLDIVKIILAGENLEVPSTYSLAFARLSEAGLISHDLAKELAALARTRNVLAHQYLDIKWERLHHFLRHGPRLLARFVEIVERKLEESAEEA